MDCEFLPYRSDEFEEEFDFVQSLQASAAQSKQSCIEIDFEDCSQQLLEEGDVLDSVELLFADSRCSKMQEEPILDTQPVTQPRDPLFASTTSDDHDDDELDFIFDECPRNPFDDLMDAARRPQRQPLSFTQASQQSEQQAQSQSMLACGSRPGQSAQLRCEASEQLREAFKHKFTSRSSNTHFALQTARAGSPLNTAVLKLDRFLKHYFEHVVGARNLFHFIAGLLKTFRVSQQELSAYGGIVKVSVTPRAGKTLLAKYLSVLLFLVLARRADPGLRPRLDEIIGYL